MALFSGTVSVHESARCSVQPSPSKRSPAPRSSGLSIQAFCCFNCSAALGGVTAAHGRCGRTSIRLRAPPNTHSMQWRLRQCDRCFKNIRKQPAHGEPFICIVQFTPKAPDADTHVLQRLFVVSTSTRSPPLSSPSVGPRVALLFPSAHLLSGR